jgi:hypothetical protein
MAKQHKLHSVSQCTAQGYSEFNVLPRVTLCKTL